MYQQRSNQNSSSPLAHQIQRNRIHSLEKEVLHLRTLVAAHNQTLVEAHRILNLASQIFSQPSSTGNHSKDEQIRRLATDLVNTQRKIPRMLDAQQAMFASSRQEHKNKKNRNNRVDDETDTDDNTDDARKKSKNGKVSKANASSAATKNNNISASSITDALRFTDPRAIGFLTSDISQLFEQQFRDWCRNKSESFETALEKPTVAFRVFQETPSEDVLQDFMEAFEDARELVIGGVNADSIPSLMNQQQEGQVENLIRTFLKNTKVSNTATSASANKNGHNDDDDLEVEEQGSDEDDDYYNNNTDDFEENNNNNNALFGKNKLSTLPPPQSSIPNVATKTKNLTSGRNTLNQLNVQSDDEDYNNSANNYYNSFQQHQQNSNPLPYEIKPTPRYSKGDDDDDLAYTTISAAGSGTNAAKQQTNNNITKNDLGATSRVTSSRYNTNNNINAIQQPQPQIGTRPLSASALSSSSTNSQSNFGNNNNNNNPPTPSRYRPEKNASTNVAFCVNPTNANNNNRIVGRSSSLHQFGGGLNQNNQNQRTHSSSPPSQQQQNNNRVSSSSSTFYNNNNTGRVALLQWQQQQLEMQLYSHTGAGTKATGSESKYYALNKKLQKIRSEILKEQRAESEVAQVQSEVVQQKKVREADRQMFGR